MLLDGLILGGYRSFGDVAQRIGPFGRINIFAGRNNAGKSNILTFISSVLRNVHKSALAEGKVYNLEPIDKHQGSDAPFAVGLASRIDSDQYNRLRARLSGTHMQQLSAVLECRSLSPDGDYVWMQWQQSNHGEKLARDPDLPRKVIESAGLDMYAWDQLFRALLPNKEGGSQEARVEFIIDNVLSPKLREVSNASLIPVVREVKNTSRDSHMSPGGLNSASAGRVKTGQ